ncbi:ComF family protein [Neobacillus sp. SM06]|uniref:ComF family protein n=1 Tax=Neobacillus sp. SM06 TaxID=3422492 RepID=UPI003D2E415B
MNTHCLICHQLIYTPVSWVTIFSKEQEEFVCRDCKRKFENISGEICSICGRPLMDNFSSGNLCLDCIRWEEDQQWCGLLNRNVSLFLYNDFLKEVIARFKFRGDYVLAKVFHEEIHSHLARMSFDYLVPIPLSAERLYERGFNQAEALIKEAGYKPELLLSRIHSEKQSKKSRHERIHLPQVFQISDDRELTGKRLILVDDIYTTGSTLRHAAKLLNQAGAASIQSLTIAR